MNIVPNKFPTLNRPNRIAIIGEAPGEHEVARGVPFVGPSGYLLDKLLSKAGLVRDAVFIGNVCQHRPINNDFNTLEWESDTVQDDIKTLIANIVSFNPNIVLCLGNAALHLAKENNIPPPHRGPLYNWPNKVGDWRGSLFFSRTFNCKAMCSYHPAACLRNYEWTPILHFDLLRLAHESTTKDLVLPTRNLRILNDADEIVLALNSIRNSRYLCALDIEGGVCGIPCISFAVSGGDCFTIPFSNAMGGNHFQTVEEEVRVWKALAELLTDPNVPKVLQNSLYDRFVLQYTNKIPVRGVVDDTMLKHWELYCELEKSLGFQCSIYTKEPYYKHERKSDSNETFLLYCAKDSAVTHEINEVLEKNLNPQAKEHYKFNVTLLNPILYMELRGIRYDSKRAAEQHLQIRSSLDVLQSQLDEVAGYGVDPATPKDELLCQVQDVLCYKRDRTRPKKGNEEVYADCEAILSSTSPLTKAAFGRLSTALGQSLNISSNKQLQEYLYERLSLPVQTDPKTKQPTCDYEALLKLSKKTGHPSLSLIIEIRTLTTRLRMLEIESDPDGRIRCGYNVVGTETGRLTCYTSPTGSGYNLQTIPSDNELKPIGHGLRKGMRDLFIADEGCYIFQCDLSGADGWTVAAHCAALGDRTMLDDYLFGLKPAKIVCLGLRGQTKYLNPVCDREEIKAACKTVEKESWDYFACKRAQHGSNYLMGPLKLADQILVDSEGEMVITKKEVEELQRLYHYRYRGVRLWHERTASNLNRKPVIVAASGHRRYFFGRSTEVLGEALAHEPQDNTTYAIKLAIYKLWTDPENRHNAGAVELDRRDGRCFVPLRIEPLHTVHDAVLGQFKITDTTWAVGKIRQYLDNTLIIAGQPIKIPFEGSYGLDWALNSESKVGNI